MDNRHAGTGERRTLLRVEGLDVRFHTEGPDVHAVRGISYTVHEGETVGLVGESGSGKSASVLGMLGLLPPDRTRVTGIAQYKDVDLISAGTRSLRRTRGVEIGLISQDPLSALNPVLTIGHQIREPLKLHAGLTGRQATERAAELLDLVGIPSPRRRLAQYPHEFSGGMRQRAMIAAAIATQPSLLVADEPTTALDVTIQAQILELLGDLSRTLHMSVILITHDLGVIAGISDTLNVMYAGRIVEHGPTQVVLSSAGHPYTRGLLRSVPRLDLPQSAALAPIPGRPPDLRLVSRGCDFEPRCSLATLRCHEERPPQLKTEFGSFAACFYAEDVANDGSPVSNGRVNSG